MGLLQALGQGAIEVAPAAVAGIAYFALFTESIDAVAAFLGGYGLLLVLAQMRLLPVYLKLRFMPSTWAFTFSWAAVAAVAIHWVERQRPPGAGAYTYVLLAAITVFVGGVALRTVVALSRRELLPPALAPQPAEQPNSRAAGPEAPEGTVAVAAGDSHS
ncbi:hypothetical protein [Streptomyces sp. NPDC001070]